MLSCNAQQGTSGSEKQQTGSLSQYYVIPKQYDWDLLAYVDYVKTTNKLKMIY